MILVTGGMGFIGVHVARELARTDDVALGYNRTLRTDDELEILVGAKVPTVRLDVTNPYSVARALHAHRPTSIVHLAVPALGAMPPAEESLANVTGLVNLLEAADVYGVDRVTIASSLTVYAGVTEAPFTEDAPLPVVSRSATGAMKKAEEILALHYADRTGLDVVILRIGVVYGPLYHTLANPVSRLTHLAVKGMLPRSNSPAWTAEQLSGGLDLCHVHDCARQVAAVHRAPAHQHAIYNVGGGRSVSAGELVEAVEAAVPGTAIPDEWRPADAAPSNRSHMDISRLTGEFGVRPELDLRAGVSQYASWLQDHDL